MQREGPTPGLTGSSRVRNCWADLEAAGLLVKTEPHTLSIGTASAATPWSRPLLSTQWFVKTKLSPRRDRGCARGSHAHPPARFNKEYYRGWKVSRDCVSRANSGGAHRIPVWYCEQGHETCARATPPACTTCGSGRLEQDPDVSTPGSRRLWPSDARLADDTEDMPVFTDLRARDRL